MNMGSNLTEFTEFTFEHSEIKKYRLSLHFFEKLTISESSGRLDKADGVTSRFGVNRYSASLNSAHQWRISLLRFV